jgi:hypothetical protein
LPIRKQRQLLPAGWQLASQPAPGESDHDRHRRERIRFCVCIAPDQELLALGAANINSGMFGGFTVEVK